MLKNISSNGIVYMPSPKADNPFSAITKYGRKEATTFTGFCGYHDKTVFQPIEDNLFNMSVEHIFLHTYRCFAVEYHKKQEVSKMEQTLFANKPSLLHMRKEENPFGGINMAIRDFEPVKKRFDKALLNKNYDILTSVVWEFNQTINFARTGFEVISHDLKGNVLQDVLEMEILTYLSWYSPREIKHTALFRG